MSELFCRLTQNCMIVGRFVMAYSLPVESLGRRFGVGITIEHLRVSAFSITPVFIHKGNSPETQFQLGAEFIFWQVALKTISFLSVRIENEDYGRPYRVETMEVSRVFFDMCFKGHEGLVDERSSLFIAV